MVPLTDLWLPIILSAVVVFIASSIVHMVLPFHRSDYQQLPEEDMLRAAMRSAGLRPGFYVFPFASHKEMGSPEILAKYKEGPVGLLTVIPNGPPAMPKFLAKWFAFCLVLGVFVASLAGRTLAPGTSYLAVFRVVGTAAFLGYAFAHIGDFIWRGRPAVMTVKELVDGLIYGLLTAGVFGWLWPR